MEKLFVVKLGNVWVADWHVTIKDISVSKFQARIFPDEVIATECAEMCGGDVIAFVGDLE